MQVQISILTRNSTDCKFRHQNMNYGFKAKRHAWTRKHIVTTKDYCKIISEVHDLNACAH